MRSGRSARLVHRYAIRLSDRQLDELRRVADVCEIPISALLRVAIRWVIAAGPAVLDGPPPVLAPEDAPASMARGGDGVDAAARVSGVDR